MTSDHPENSKSGKETKEAANGSITPSCKEQPAPRSDEPRSAVKRPSIGSPAQLRASELYKSQFSAAERMRKILDGSASEQIRKVISVAGQMQSIARISNPVAEQILQIGRTIRPINTIKGTVGHLARNAAGNSMRWFLDEQASRHRQMMDLLRPTWDQTLVGGAFSDSLRAIQSFNSVYQTEAFRVQETIRRQVNSAASLIEVLRSKLPSFDQLSDFWLRYPTRVKENLVALATAGWYLDPEMSVSDIVHFKEDLENGTVEEVNEELVQHFRSSLDRIEASLCEDHPTRAKLIKEAFEAHREGKYSLSIPALFAQADGICLDLTGYHVFTGRGLSRFAKRIDPETLERVYLEPLLRTMPIMESSRQRRAVIPHLNRHAVMHGESTDFPSEPNGLKAISFINFVSHVLGMAISWRNEMAVLPASDESLAALN